MCYNRDMKKLTILCFALILGVSFSGEVFAVSKAQEAAISDHCDTIRDSLKNVQKMDARTRVFLGSHYETVLSKFITPLNLRLVENNLSDMGLIGNQNKFATVKATFSADFISYQQELEVLVNMDCKTGPDKFYEKLELVRAKRKTMTLDVRKMKDLMTKNIELVEKIKGNL